MVKQNMADLAKPVIFISYSHKDKDWKNRLVTHLGVLEEDGQLALWEDNRIDAGDDWYEEIHQAMKQATVAVLLISANSLTSKFILREEVKQLLQRRREEGVRIFPVIIKSCAWQQVEWLRRMQVRPREGKPLSSLTGNKRDQALTEIVQEIHRLLHAATPSPTGEVVLLQPDDIAISRLPVTGPDLFGRDRQLRALDEAWASGLNVLSLVAWGGVGKSALINHWLNRMSADHYRRAEKIYAWSFHSQGATDRPVSADLFIDSALRWFGDPSPTTGFAWNKGERLARLIRRQRTLLLLDGLEPLQNPPGYEEGRLKDQAMIALLRELAADNPGLCVITTRIQVNDLANFEGRSVRHIDLEHLLPDAGAQLLRAQNVVGNPGELEQASIDFGGHSLALTLLGSYLRDGFAGDVRRRSQIASLEEDVRYGGQARRVMVSYEKWFGDGPELAVLRMLGLFNRPADGATLAALRAAPAIANLTDALQSLSEPQWNQILAKLRRARLLSASQDQPDTLDTHPLVREYFGKRLKQDYPAAWREANDRIYEHLKRTTPAVPDTFEELSRLYTAIAHGCEAGRHQDALAAVYTKRIVRGEAYSWYKFSAFSLELDALSSFFRQTWDQVEEGLADSDKGHVMNQAGMCLMYLGRLKEAAQALLASLRLEVTLNDVQAASPTASNLSNLFMISGDLRQALHYARQALEMESRTPNRLFPELAWWCAAGSFFQMGRMPEAEAHFRKAEEIQKQNSPHWPILLSFSGFLYGNFLLALGDYRRARNRAKQMLQYAQKHRIVRDMALSNLLLGRSLVVDFQSQGKADLKQAASHLTSAAEGLRQAGTPTYLPLALLARAELRRIQGQYEEAQTDLDEAMAIAGRGDMKLYLADAHLEYAQLYLDQGKTDKARESLATAKAMIEEMGYHRRDQEVQAIERRLGEASGQG